jgi:K+-sensing histidine kinase KdpD
LRVARQNNVTQIVLGKSLGSPLLDFLRGGSLVDRVIRKSGNIATGYLPGRLRTCLASRRDHRR